MNVGQVCQQNIVTIRASEELTEAARLMRERHVGYLVVAEPHAETGLQKIVGVLTDRDIVVGAIGRGVDPRALRVEDLMTRAPITAASLESVEGALQKMRRVGVRRVPVSGTRGELFGVLSVDDALYTISEELSNIAGAIGRETATEAALRA